MATTKTSLQTEVAEAVMVLHLRFEVDTLPELAAALEATFNQFKGRMTGKVIDVKTTIEDVPAKETSVTKRASTRRSPTKKT